MSPRTSERRNCRLKGAKQSYAPTASANIPSIHKTTTSSKFFLPVKQWVLNKLKKEKATQNLPTGSNMPVLTVPTLILQIKSPNSRPSHTQLEGKGT